MFLNGAYYWYGENKEFTDPAKGIWHWGVRGSRSINPGVSGAFRPFRLGL